jgi:hypothetical protein
MAEARRGLPPPSFMPSRPPCAQARNRALPAPNRGHHAVRCPGRAPHYAAKPLISQVLLRGPSRWPHIWPHICRSLRIGACPITLKYRTSVVRCARRTAERSGRPRSYEQASDEGGLGRPGRAAGSKGICPGVWVQDLAPEGFHQFSDVLWGRLAGSYPLPARPRVRRKEDRTISL